jgi:rRNA maturation endonuclease Nob1
MSEKITTAECENCESTFEVAFEEDYVSDESPSFCPFCGERIEVLNEEYIDDEDFDENEEWK